MSPATAHAEINATMGRVWQIRRDLEGLYESQLEGDEPVSALILALEGDEARLMEEVARIREELEAAEEAAYWLGQ